MKPTSVELVDRYRGAMVGTLVGDAMGAPVEWQTPAKVVEYFEQVGGYHLHDYLDPWAIRRGKKPNTVFAGQATDDSELAAALAESLLEYPEFNAVDLYGRLRSFMHDRKAILSDRAYGQGGTLKAALEPMTYEESLVKFASGDVPTPPSNGSLMRSIAVPLRAKASMAQMIYLASSQSAVTHRNSESMAACIAYSIAVSYVLNGMEPGEAWETTKKTIGNPPTAYGIASGFENILSISLARPDYETEMKDKEGYVVLSLRVALWAAAEATDFADGIKKAISVGGDTDTYAAIAGGMLGAHFGIEGIPKEWREKARGIDKMTELADGLCAVAHS